MTERRYTLSEIDRMRKAFREKIFVEIIAPTIGCVEIAQSMSIEERNEEAESQLRTALMAGIGPEEVEKANDNAWAAYYAQSGDVRAKDVNQASGAS